MISTQSWSDPNIFPLNRHHLRLAELTTPRRYRPVIDPVGHVYIGLGRELTKQGLGDDEIELMLYNDLRDARDYLLQHYHWVLRLDPVRFAALQELCMRMGTKRFDSYQSIWYLMETDSYAEAGKALSAAAWCSKAGRAVSEHLIIMLVTGDWPWDVLDLAESEPATLSP